MRHEQRLSPKLQHELALFQRAARNPKLKTAIAAYDRLRAHGVEHAQAVREAAETADLDPEGKLN
jgi:hypothetical protein